MRHFKHHARFYAALAIGVIAWALAAKASAHTRQVIGGDAFFAAYLVFAFALIIKATPDWFQRRAEYEDEGLPLIGVITAAAVLLSLFSIFGMLKGGGGPDLARIALAIMSVILGWTTLHTVLAFHYGHRFYADVVRDGVKTDARGISFPETEYPTAWDFFYFSMVIGMTAQVSDTAVTTTRMRRLVTAHAIASFFFNAGILALAVNVAAGAQF